MSNHYAIATVTATLQQLLDKAVSADVPGATATMVRPNGPGSGVPDPGVNIFLYQVTPSPAARNEDLPTRSSDGRLVSRPRVGLDLHYLLTFYGKDAQFEPQRVLGSSVRTLHARPVLTRPQIEQALTAFPVLALSDLSHDVELVKFTQLPLTLEELSKLWAVFFQTTYHLSVAYQGTVVLIESEESFASALPVRLRNLYVETFRAPVIEAVVAASGDDDPILAGAAIVIRGHQLFGPVVDVLVDGVPAVTGTITDSEVAATLPAAQAGVHGLQVQRPRPMGTPEVDHAGVVSNVFPFVLTPKIKKNGAYHISLANQTTKTVGGTTYHSADITVDLDPVVGKDQRVTFLLDELTAVDPKAYAFVSASRPADNATITIRAVDVIPGTYLLRVRVDGAESPLDVTGNLVLGPEGDLVSDAWMEDNQRALAAELERIAALTSGEVEAPDAEPAPRVDVVVRAFGLSPFERDVLLLCAGVELDARFGGLCSAATGDERIRRPTFSSALSCLPEPHWSALAPEGPLRRWRLVELEPGETVATSALRLDERIVHHLTGLDYLDERLRGIVEPFEAEPVVSPSQAAVAAQVADACARWAAAPTVITLAGADAADRRAVAVRAAAIAGVRLHVADAADLPAHPAERNTFARLWERETVLANALLLVELDDGADGELRRRTEAVAAALGVPALLSAREPLRPFGRIAFRIDVPRPGSSEQRALWTAAVGAEAAALNGTLDSLVATFDLGPQAIAAAATQAASGDGPVADRLRTACRLQARPRLDDLAQRIETVAGWDDLVLPTAELEILREIALHVRARVRVYDDWGFAGKSVRGLGISALFTGPSGTGKTMAAEILAGELDLDLYRIDLSQVVSKYIGETERNLRRVFDAAESGGAVLLFDEADALFGKRTEVKDSHDRYANIEVSYLLQRMEAYRGLAILTTNRREAIDSAFMRRIRFVVSFPFPDEAGRTEIWRRIFPAATPLDGIDHEALGKIAVAGGNIRNIALLAAFLAADEQAPIGMGHLARAAERECSKLERPLAEAEVRGWR